MTKNDTEADARLLIDVMLRQAGWDRAEKSQVRTARRKDYILNSSKGQPIVDEIAENDLNLGAGRYKPQVGEQPPDEDFSDLISKTLKLKRDIASGLGRLLKEIDATS